ncbi:unnamed protein product [Phytophthora fragariaefolia]|uniref:Unnamed protein product n=1 Tax=Phytophthora fragariaefolia TaxID=1490495 RepID=A0A9W6XYQ1_9STRA|nr:unnamed protein product [Phytophthora fragariaefolia]
MFRLISVLFSDKFAPRIAENNGPVSRTDLDRGVVNGKSQFWTDVAGSFAEDRLVYGWLVASHPKFGGVRPWTVTMHNGVKLRGKWGEITSEYQRCLSNFNSESGTHTPIFFSFCYGRIDILYLHFWLEKRPNLLAAVAGRLADATQVDTMRPKNLVGTPEKQTSGTATGSTPSRKNKELAPLREMVGLVGGGSVDSHDVDPYGLLYQLKTTIETIGLLQAQLRDATDADQANDLHAGLLFSAGIKNKIKEELRC